MNGHLADIKEVMDATGNSQEGLTTAEAEKAMETLKKMTVASVKVIRNNYAITITSTPIVPGDIILLGAGNVVPADIRLSEAIQLKINESSLTGESLAIEKQVHK